MPEYRRTKIVCTIGPASRKRAVLEKMLAAGMNVARLNFSHGTHAEHGQAIRTLRSLARRTGQPLAILQDIAGPKIRVGAFAAGPVELNNGQLFTLTERNVPGDAESVSVNFKGLARAVRKGDLLLLCDGLLEARVERVEGPDIRCRILHGGTISSHKGINLPMRSMGIPALTAKDRQDLRFGLEQGVDYVALSFVRTAAEIRHVRRLARAQKKEVQIIAKIEKPEALKNLDEIIAEADGVMVARGDLGVELPYEQVPMAQRRIIETANAAGKPVITATQMLESMVASPRPTRAEVTDVAGAILLGTDAVMLSEESAAGQFPVEAVAALARIAREIEKSFPYRDWSNHFVRTAMSVEESVARAADALAEDVGVAALIVHTASGAAARRIAKYRPPMPILAVTDRPEICRRLALVWGVVPLRIRPVRDTEHMIRLAVRQALAAGWIRSGEKLAVTAGQPLGSPGHTNMVRVLTAGAEGRTF